MEENANKWYNGVWQPRGHIDDPPPEGQTKRDEL